ncbi:hypothetical protein [Escherichia coli]|uniref:hypothetical protein n=1 Tax=Escherichia coli TaxID=562 RepID=UPI00379F95E9
MKKTAPDGAVSGMPAIRETGPGKNLQAITVSTSVKRFSFFAGIKNRWGWQSGRRQGTEI